jgi:plasmid stabilization system protein ParE
MKSKDVVWTSRALKEYKNLIDHLLENWSLKITEEVTTLINSSVSKLNKNPKHYPLISKKDQIRSFVISKQTTIFFVDSENSTTIISVFDNRQNPKKRPQ